jgi:hypothetical protein
METPVPANVKAACQQGGAVQKKNASKEPTRLSRTIRIGAGSKQDYAGRPLILRGVWGKICVA